MDFHVNRDLSNGPAPKLVTSTPSDGRRNCPTKVLKLLYAHGEMYGSVTVTQGSPYISNAVTHPRYMSWRVDFSKSPRSAQAMAFLGICVHE
jgi:hypothetical protein